MPTSESLEIKSKVIMHEDDEKIIPGNVGEQNEIERIRFYIKKEDVKEFGITPGCPGCLAANAGADEAQNHIEGCRKRFKEELTRRGGKIGARIAEDFLKHQEEDREEEKTNASEKDDLKENSKDEEMLPEEAIEHPDEDMGCIKNLMRADPMEVDDERKEKGKLRRRRYIKEFKQISEILGEEDKDSLVQKLTKNNHSLCDFSKIGTWAMH